MLGWILHILGFGNNDETVKEYESIERSIERIDEEAEKSSDDDITLDHPMRDQPLQDGSGISDKENLVLVVGNKNDKEETFIKYEYLDSLRNVIKKIRDDKEKVVKVSDCATCVLKKKDEHDKKLLNTVEKVVKEMSAMSEDEWNTEIYKCNPKTCEGECGGDGWCPIAKDWMKKITVASYNFPVKEKTKKNIKKYPHLNSKANFNIKYREKKRKSKRERRFQSKRAYR